MNIENKTLFLKNKILVNKAYILNRKTATIQ
jgi:hypothetical protein